MFYFQIMYLKVKHSEFSVNVIIVDVILIKVSYKFFLIVILMATL